MPRHDIEPPAAGVDPDGLQRLWTPHRMAYVTRDEGSGDVDGDVDGDVGGDVTAASPAAAHEVPLENTQSCPFCRIPTLPDEDGLIVARGEHVYALLNLYPYNAGHLMVLPYRHIGDYVAADRDESTEMAALTQHAINTIRSVSAPHGFNIGINIGGAAGAGIAAHLHQHVVPRWNGDANFMPVIGHTKVLPQLLRDTRQLIADAW